ncbi:MAG TPA: hypothetical protein VF089_06630 [Candidatus Binatia bacterium]
MSPALKVRLFIAIMHLIIIVIMAGSTRPPPDTSDSRRALIDPITRIRYPESTSHMVGE